MDDIADVPLSHSKEHNYQEDEIAIEQQSSLRSEMAAVYVSSVGEGTEILTNLLK